MTVCPETGLPLGDTKPAMDLPHFPTSAQAVIWRNWGLVTAETLAGILGTSSGNIVSAADELGLGQAASPAQERLWRRRGYITLIRQNWHLLDYPQLLKLLDWSSATLAYTLKEDDFLWNKLGNFKPDVSVARWQPLNPAQRQATARIRKTLSGFDLASLPPPDVSPFGFLDRYGQQVRSTQADVSQRTFGLKLVYSYSAVYGDPLIDPELDPYPDGLLADLSSNGVTAVWLQGVLYSLVPWLGDEVWSQGCEERIQNLNRLIAKADAHGIGVYLYLNEPRGMPGAFFEHCPEARGTYLPVNEQYAICLSAPGVLERFQNGVSALFEQAPGLAGVFTITMSENLTHCHSKAHNREIPVCERCQSRPIADLVAAVNNAIAAGAHAVKPEADVIAWNWSWEAEWGNDAIDRLRPDIKLMCTSESFLPTKSGGIDGLVGDYTISRVGPGPVAKQFWSHAVARGLTVLAKVQMNNTWECSAVPYLPVPFLVQAHLRNLKAYGVSGLMAAWTLGGYPGGNLRLAESEPEALALEMFGEKAAKSVLKAWKRFGEAFSEFPLHACFCLYIGPQNYGPMNLLFMKPSGYRGTMLGFPYDDLDLWRGPRFPAPVFEDQFRRLSEGWAEGLAILSGVADARAGEASRELDDLRQVAEAAYCHFRSTYLQVRFINLRDHPASPGEHRIHMRAVLDEEIGLARKLLSIMRKDSRIGFEASNHYYYTENSLLEKILNCDMIARSISDPPGHEGAQSVNGKGS